MKRNVIKGILLAIAILLLLFPPVTEMAGWGTVMTQFKFIGSPVTPGAGLYINWPILAWAGFVLVFTWLLFLRNDSSSRER